MSEEANAAPPIQVEVMTVPETQVMIQESLEDAPGLPEQIMETNVEVHQEQVAHRRFG